MPNILQSQGSALVPGVNAFAPLVEKLHEDFKAGRFSDWPTVILTQTMQAESRSQAAESATLSRPSIASALFCCSRG
jgi:hypothetical protein